MNIGKIFYSNCQKNNKIQKFDKPKSLNSLKYNKFLDKNMFSYPKNYYISFKGEDFKQQLEKKLQEASEEEIYSFLYKKLRNKAEEIKMHEQYIDDAVQEAILNIFILIKRTDISQDVIISEINNIYEKLKPHKSNFIGKHIEISIDKKIPDSKKCLLDIIPDDEEHRIQYLHPPDEKQREETRKKINTALSKANLNDKQNLLLQERYSGDGIISTENLAKKYGVSKTIIARIIKQAIIKTQIANNSLNDDTKTRMANLSSIFGLDIKTIQAISAKHPFILTSHLEVMKNNADNLINKFKDSGLTYDKYISAIKKQPQLLIQTPETIEKNIKEVVEKFKENGLTTEKYLKAALKHPGLFYHSPDTIEKNIKDLVKKFEKNGLTVEQYIKSALKYPSLFASSPDTIEKNTKEVVEKFKENGLTTEQYIHAAIEYPCLFASSSDTIEKNIKGAVDIFKNDGLTTEKYIQSLLKRPCLFSFLPETIEKNIKGLVKKFEENGLTTEQYIKAAIHQPALFYRSPDSIEKNIRELVKKFQNQGLVLDHYILAALKQPSLFTMLPDTIAQHIDVLRFAEFNKGKEIDNKEFFNKILSDNTKLCYSSSTLMIKTVIIPKMFENDRIPKSLQDKHLKENLTEYLRNNPNKTYAINVKNIPSDNNCIDLLNKTLKEISIKASGRNDIFKVKTDNKNI